MKRKILFWAVLLLLFFTACGKAEQNRKEDPGGTAETPAADTAETPAADTAEAPAADAAEPSGTAAEENAAGRMEGAQAAGQDGAARNTEGNETSSRSGDRVLASVNAAVDGTRTLRLDAIGRAHSERTGHYLVRKIEVYEDGKALQTLSVSEARTVGEAQDASPSSSAALDGMECASIQEALAALDVNFDGSDDLDLCEWVSSYSTLHHYWTWNGAIGRYLYACTLQDPQIHPLEKEIISKYNTASVYYADVYHPAPDGTLALASRELEDWDRGTEDFPLLERYEYPDGEETLVRQEFTDYDDAGRTMREIRVLVNGVLTPVFREELEVTDGSIRVIRVEPILPSQPEIPEEELLEEEWPEDAAESAE